ncbi:hypothetical protein [Hymenobacter psychrotolerans]|uniref:Uncharacterized protein n=1 Tax=Hymenobacter psychrotolerans DSM 18569 TaxID=1121959 RepID=A0A1M6WK46_9BACT|nr:hypothetical protein [Hymenobacter psychrotolerans]SHK93974.1 hypothetical protein SAMN02746009_01818 [Hymenobacter psychrotolerans DSM 18569]
MLPPEERRLQTLGRLLTQPAGFPPTAWLCAPPDVSRWQPDMPAAVLLVAAAGQPVPTPPGLVRTLFMDEVQLVMERLVAQVPGAPAALRVSILARYKTHYEFPALTSHPDTLADHLAEAVRAGGLTPAAALAQLQRYFAHFTPDAAERILAQAFLRLK